MIIGENYTLSVWVVRLAKQNFHCCDKPYSAYTILCGLEKCL